MRPARKFLATAAALLLAALCSTTALAGVTVTLTAPADGTVYPAAPATLVLEASASANQGYGVTQVDFYQGTTLIGSATTAPYTVTWSNVPAGSYSLTAQATARKSNGATQSATSTPASVRVNVAPSADLTAPAPNAVFTAPAAVTVSASASDADGTVTQVEFFANGASIGTAATAPYSVQWTNVAAGSYSLTAVATDNDGASTTSAAVPIAVNAAPTVSITSPANNATFSAPASITISADAADADGSITRVDFYAGATLLGSATTAPYTYDWTNVGLGTYALTAHAIDNNNGETVSAPVNITVTAPASTLYFIEVDHLNTPRLVADATGTTVWKWDQQEPFGDSAPNEDPDGDLVAFSFPMRFPGQYADTETGREYNMARNYDANLARYLESDRLGLVGGLNTYLYVKAKPIAASDASGNCPWCLAAIAGGLIGGGLNLYSQLQGDAPINWVTVGLSAAGGAVSGASGSWVASVTQSVWRNAVAGGLINATVSLATSSIQNTCSAQKPTFSSLARNFAINFALGGVGGGIGQLASNAGRAWQIQSNQLKLHHLFTVGYYSPPTTNLAPLSTGIGVALANAISNSGPLVPNESP